MARATTKPWHSLQKRSRFGRRSASKRSWNTGSWTTGTAALGPEISALRRGAGVISGDGDHTIVLLASVQTICQALRQLDQQHEWGARGRDRQIVRFRARGVGARGWHRETVTCVGASSFAITASAMRNASFDRRQPTRAPQLCLRDRQWEKGRLRTPSARRDRCALQSHFVPPQNFCMERHVARLQKPRWTSGARIRLRSSAAELS